MKRAVIGVVVLCISGCLAEEGGALEIMNAPAIDESDCVFKPDEDTLISSGWYDPRGLYGAGPWAFLLGLSLRNNLSRTDAHPTIDPETERQDRNDAILLGYDVCWFREDMAGTGAFESMADGVPEALQCENLADASKGFIAASGYVEAGGGDSSSGVWVLEIGALRSLYGPDFTPWAIPSYDPGGGYVSLASEDPTDPATRSVAWGNYPASRDSRVILQLRATAKTQSGKTVMSNWFVFPINLCVGCMYCEVAVIEQNCAVGTAYVGWVPDISGCLPFQGYATCVEATGCP